MIYRGYLALFALLLLTCTNLHAGPNLLTSNWISCADNNRTRSFRSFITLNEECLYQEVTAQQNDNLHLVCDANGNNFTSAQLSYSDQNFRVLSSALDTTTGSETLRVNAGRAPQNTRIAVATIFANARATLSCTLAAPDDPEPTLVPQATASNPAPAPTIAATQPVANTRVPGPCIDSDNDGFGWNGFETCIPDNPQPTASAVAPIAAPATSTNTSVQATATTAIEAHASIQITTASVGTASKHAYQITKEQQLPQSQIKTSVLLPLQLTSADRVSQHPVSTI